MKFKAQVQQQDGGKRVFLGYSSTPPRRRPPPTLAQSTAAPTLSCCTSLALLPLPLALRSFEPDSGDQRQQHRLKGVSYCPKQTGSTCGCGMAASVPSATYFATAEQAALFYARKEAGRDTSDLTAPPPPPA